MCHIIYRFFLGFAGWRSRRLARSGKRQYEIVTIILPSYVHFLLLLFSFITSTIHLPRSAFRLCSRLHSRHGRQRAGALEEASRVIAQAA